MVWTYVDDGADDLRGAVSPETMELAVRAAQAHGRLSGVANVGRMLDLARIS